MKRAKLEVPVDTMATSGHYITIREKGGRMGEVPLSF